LSVSALIFRSVAEAGLAPAADVLARGFADYFVPMSPTAASLSTMERVDSVDPSLSCLAYGDAGVVGVALVARRDERTRVAGMAIVPSARRQGVGRALMEHLLAEATARGDQTMELEVIERNVAAVKLYERLGFTCRQRLVGHVGPASGREAPELEEVDVGTVARMADLHGTRGLPWQLAARTIAELGPPHLAFRLGPSYALISDPSSSPISIRALVTTTPDRRQGHALRLLQALFARYPARDWRVSSVWPEDLSKVFTRAGLAIAPLGQWHMSVALSRDASRSPS
jgi:ribosomal protein S18 acetylase RimI-like enzyme